MEFPPGIRFKPTEEELIVSYLKPKVDEQPVPSSEINIVDFYKYDPQTLADEHPSRLGQKEWYFFTFREKKYQNGKRPNRSAGNGYWKATAANKRIHLGETKQIIGYKKNLVYYEGDHKYSRKTDWIMHEYTLPIADPTPPKTKKLPEDENDMRLDSWVICQIHKREIKSNKAELDDNNMNLALVALPPPPQEMDERRHHHQHQQHQQQHQHQQAHHHQHQLQQQHYAFQQVVGNNYFSIEEFSQALQQQQQMDYQQQQQQQYNPFPLVGNYFPEDDPYYGQYDLQPPQQMHYQQQQDAFFQPRQQDEGFQPRQQQDEGFQPQQQQDGFFGFFQPQQDEESEYIASLLQNFV